jgi:inosine-uridine nucleoside N-ribohydrolase
MPDAAAVIYALKPDLGTPTPALIEVMTSDTVVRGQTIIATDMEEKVIMIADDAELSELADHAFDQDFDLDAALFDILQRRSDNAAVVLQVQAAHMSRSLERTLTR